MEILPGSNIPPVADAGEDRSVHIADDMVLDGSGSTDINGDRLRFSWGFSEQPPDSTAWLNGADTLNPAFMVDVMGSYRVQLVVNDGEFDSEPDEVIVTTVNAPPLADAGPDQTAFVTDTAHLDGSASGDVDGDPLAFAWTLVDRPVDSVTELDGADTPSPSLFVDLPGEYLAELVVNDGQYDSEPSLVLVSTVNSAPVADAGPDIDALVGDEVLLDGGASYDVDGDPLTWTWSLANLPEDSNAALQDAGPLSARFTPDLPGAYVGQLAVHDGGKEGARSFIVPSQ